MPVPSTHSGFTSLGIWSLLFTVGFIIDTENLFPYHTHEYNGGVRVTFVETAEECPETNYALLRFCSDPPSKRKISGFKKLFGRFFLLFFIFLFADSAKQQKSSVNLSLLLGRKYHHDVAFSCTLGIISVVHFQQILTVCIPV